MKLQSRPPIEEPKIGLTAITDIIKKAIRYENPNAVMSITRGVLRTMLHLDHIADFALHHDVSNRQLVVYLKYDPDGYAEHEIIAY